MNILEVYQENLEILEKSKKIKKIINNLSAKEKKQDICSIKNADYFFTLLSLKNPQEKAPLAEKYVKQKLFLENVSPLLDKGDAKDENDKHYEIKVSFSNKLQTLNVRQIRIWQDIDFYICAYIDECNIENSLFFKLTKEEMEEEISLCGNYSHGVKEINNINTYNEYSITIPIKNLSNQKTERWLKKYLSNDIKNIILFND